jgi:hypothetical protein
MGQAGRVQCAEQSRRFPVGDLRNSSVRADRAGGRVKGNLPSFEAGKIRGAGSISSPVGTGLASSDVLELWSSGDQSQFLGQPYARDHDGDGDENEDPLLDADTHEVMAFV